MKLRSPLDEGPVAPLAEFARQALRQQSALAKQSIELTRATLSGDLSAPTAGKTYVDLVRREGRRSVRAAGELGLDYATTLVALGARMTASVVAEGLKAAQHTSRMTGSAGTQATDRDPSSGDTLPTGIVAEVVDAPAVDAGEADPMPSSPGGTAPEDVATQGRAAPEGRATPSRRATPSEPPKPSGRAAPEPGKATPQPGGAVRRIEVVLRGRLGDRVEGSVTVSNQHTRARRINLSAGPLTDAADTEMAGALKVQPQRVTVPAGEDRAVDLFVDLMKDRFTAGSRYTGMVEVTGGDEATVDVVVEVEA